MSKALQNQLSKSLREQGDMARDMAMAELKDLKKDLQELEKTLTAKKARFEDFDLPGAWRDREDTVVQRPAQRCGGGRARGDR